MERRKKMMMKINQPMNQIKIENEQMNELLFFPRRQSHVCVCLVFFSTHYLLLLSFLVIVDETRFLKTFT